jgi:hypothetical protein
MAIAAMHLSTPRDWRKDKDLQSYQELAGPELENQELENYGATLR